MRGVDLALLEPISCSALRYTILSGLLNNAAKPNAARLHTKVMQQHMLPNAGHDRLMTATCS